MKTHVKAALAIGAIFLGGVGFRAQLISALSPTFDEPYFILQGVHHEQTGRWLYEDVHTSAFSWWVGKVATRVGSFMAVDEFIRNRLWFQNSYRFRLDLLSGLNEAEVVVRLRWVFQAFWFVGLASLLYLGRRMKMPPAGQVTLAAFWALEPVILSHSALISTDIAVSTLLAFATAMALSPRGILRTAALIVFTLAWMIKWTALLWLLPLAVGVTYRKIPKLSLVAWATAAPLSLLFGKVLGGWNLSSPLLRYPAERLSFLDGMVTEVTATTYFLQAVLCKLSLVALIAGIAIVWTHRRNGSLRIAFLFGVALLAASFILPGIGVRLVLPLIVALVFVISMGFTDLGLAGLLTLALMVETGFSRDLLLAYQNPLAGNTPRLLDSNRDWGQGMKELARWRAGHPDGELALALFGGGLPEVYGISNYHSLPSYPELSGTKSIKQRLFSGYVGVSENFIHGYAVNDPRLRALADRVPIRRFQGGLYLFDFRSSNE